MRSVHANLRRAANLANRRLAIHAGERLRLHPVLGFPKSGTTWLCQMLADTLALPFAQFPLFPVVRPSVLHGHWSYHPRLRRVVFVIRDGRDCMVSFYFFHKLMHDAGERTELPSLYPPGTDLNDVRSNLPRFIEHIFRRPMGAHSTWPQYNRSWLNRPGVVHTRYESLQADPAVELTRICEQLGSPVPPASVRAAVDRWSMPRVTGREPGQEDRASFIRKGTTGDWVACFNREARAIFADLAGDALVELGYERSADPQSWATSDMGHI